MDQNIKKLKVALICICVNPPYWEYVGPMLKSAKQFFLPNHNVDFLLWSDMPEETTYGSKVFNTEPVEWPLPTLMRYHLFLQQEEKLREYDYVFYCDADMIFVDTVGDEILGDGLTGAEHPMYHFRKGLRFPLETNPKSQAYIPVPQFYYAGGFQGGKTDEFIKAMKVMKRSIDLDFTSNYVARWNDESHWNRYLFDNPPVITLGPAYVYPDSLINEYYNKIWGEEIKPKLITITKKFSLSKEAGDEIKKNLATL